MFNDAADQILQISSSLVKHSFNESTYSFRKLHAENNATSSDTECDAQWAIQILSELGQCHIIQNIVPASECTSLLNKYRHLQTTLSQLEDQLKVLPATNTVNDRVEKKLEQEEVEWEKEMSKRKRLIAQRKAELEALESQSTIQKSDIEREIEDLEKAHSLRLAEIRDLNAVIESIKFENERKRKRKSIESIMSPASLSSSSADLEKLKLEYAALQAKRKALLEENQFSTAERCGDANANGQCDALASLHTELEKNKRVLHCIKQQFRTMVTARLHMDKCNVSVESVLLDVLYSHNGEMGMEEIKNVALLRLKSQGVSCDSDRVMKALYGLVAHDIVGIDRSTSEGMVMLLLL